MGKITKNIREELKGKSFDEKVEILTDKFDEAIVSHKN